MTSVTMLREHLDVVIGVDTHVETHTACAVRVDNGAVLDRITVPTTTAGRELVQFALTCRRATGRLRAEHVPA